MPEDDVSSYGTGESDQDAGMAMTTRNDSNGLTERLDDIKRCIAALDSTQNAIVAKLATLEKVVTCVQEDVTLVRADVAVVHEILENLDDHVRMLSRTVATVEGVPAQRPPEVSAWGPWPGNANGKDSPMEERTRSEEEDRVLLGEDEPNHIHGGHDADSAIRETQMFDMNTAIQAEITSLADEDGVGDFYEHEAARGISAEGLCATQVNDEENAPHFDVRQMEMTLAATATETQAPGRSSWSDYTSTIQTIAPRTHGGGDSSEVWVPSKRGRGNNKEFGIGNGASVLVDDLGGHGNLNLNLSPEKLDAVGGVGGQCCLHTQGVQQAGDGCGDRDEEQAASRGLHLLCPVIVQRSVNLSKCHHQF